MTHVSPSKGKAREATRSTELGWWDVFPLTETPKRPVQWSLSSVMFMGAAAQPLILGRNFSNSKQFPLPSPTAIASAPTHYLPPTCLLVSPNEEFVFAFFPGREVAGVGCIWMRGYTNDMWGVLKTWAFAKGAGVVGGQWLGGPRQWAFGPAESLIRLPPQGPRMPAADSVLLLITEDHQVHLKYSRPENTPRAQGYPQFQTSLQASLERPNYVIETRGASDTEPIPKPVSDFLCFDIAIGVHFSEPRIFIAHRSRCINSSNLETPSFDMSMDMKNGAICPPDWELVGQESMIHVSAIDLRMKDTLVVMEVTPLSPITNVPRYVTQMSFMSFPSEEAKTGTDKVEVALDNFFLSVSSFDMKNYDTAALKSTLDLYRLRRVPSADKESPSIWQLHNSTVVDGALAFVAPATQPQTVSEGIAFVGVLDVMGKPSKAQTRKNETSVGNIRVLNIPSLTENSRWEPTPIWSSAVAHGLPHAGSISPNHKFIWEPSFSIWYLQTSIETLPQRLRGESKYSPNAISLALAIQSRKAVSDIIQVIARPTVPIQEAVVCVQQALNLLRAVPMGAQFPVICELVGISLELYKTRGALSKNESEKADMEARWKVAQDMASLAVARVAFEDCSIEGYGYEESAIWSLNKLTQSILEFVKELMKACVLAATLAGPPSPTDDDDDLFGGGEASESPSWNPPSALLHFCYPFALENFTVLVMHIKRFRNYMASLQPPQDEVARHVLNDMIDYCPVDMAELETFLKATAEGLRKLDVESLDEGFAACKPTASLTPYLRSICEKIIEHPTLLDKARLFVEPYDLLDGVARMSEGHKLKGKDIDIVTKQSLHNKTQWLCIRCEGRRRSAFQSPAGPSPKWKAWEKKFRTSKHTFAISSARYKLALIARVPATRRFYSNNMPKSTISNLPVSGLFGVMKPSGPTSMSIVHDLQQLVARSKLFVAPDKLEEIKKRKPRKGKGKQAREAIKIGQGGTLDPLADGVLVIGVGKGTKKLSDFLNCTKEYETTCLLGCETDTYDSEGKRVRLAPWHHVTREMVEAALAKFTGEISQTPPIFSALKMDGKPLYEYARKGIPLPRPIEPRQVTIHSLELVEWKGTDHSYQWPEKTMSEDEKKAMEVALKSVDETAKVEDEPEAPSDAEPRPAAFVLKMRVSGGTYVRSIVHDLAHEIGSAGHVVTLKRTRQGRFVRTVEETGDQTCIPWEVFQKATGEDAVDEDGWTEWERQVMEHLEVIEEHGSKQ